jgi:uncharacterized protein
MPTRARVVVDTNVLVSRLILPESLPADAVRKAEREARLLISDATLYELAEVLSRRKFNRYVSRDNRRGFVERLAHIAEFVPIIRVVRECRDPKDDKFLEVALNGRADVIVTGDKDLLRMGPWRGIEIVSPAYFLAKVKS